MNNFTCHEGRRLGALQRYCVLDTPAEASFDEIAQLARYVCATPIALISLVDGGRQWFKSHIGVGIRETPLDVSICSHAILQENLFVIPDTTLDRRFADNPLVIGEPHLRFYAGAPLKTSDGFIIGTLCVLDYEPRQLSAEQGGALITLANQVMSLLELRRVSMAQTAAIEEQRELRLLQEEAALTAVSSERWLRAVLEATPECVKIVSSEGEILLMNAAGLNLLEFDSLAELKAADLRQLVVAADWERLLEMHVRACAGETLAWEFEVIGAKGKHSHVETHAVPLRLQDGRYGELAVSRDITRRKRVELERERLLESEREARAQAEKASRMKDEFLANLSHELRTPLNAILGWAQLLLRGGLDPGESAQGLEIIERNARVQTQLIEDLLDMSRIISGKIRLDIAPVDASVFIRAAVETVRPAAQAKGISLRIDLDPIHCQLVGDSNRLQQVVWNLLSNAIKFTPNDGEVRVELSQTGRECEIRVRDSGQGISLEFLPFVFDRFRQQDASITRRQGGLGLGLSIVKQLVELHGGGVRAESEGQGRGTLFT